MTAGLATPTGRPDFRVAPSRGAIVMRAGVALVLITVAYHHSLSALLVSLSSDTPLAYVGFVPVLALVLAAIKARPGAGEARLPDRQFDWIIGIPLVGLALGFAVLLPERLSYSFWTNRIDLLGLPLFVAGLVALLFGSRVLYRIRLPIVFLLLAWPFPYEHFLNRVLSLSTSLALWGVARGLPVLGGARLVADSVYRVGEGTRQFSVNVAPTCAGANSAMGFLLVGGAAVLVLKGRRARKLGWLAFGVALMLLLNTVRVLLLFWAGDRYGEDVMLGWLHPYAGLAFFLVGCLITMVLLPRFGIGMDTAPGRPPDPVAGSSGGPGAATVSSTAGARAAFVLVVVLAVWLGSLNGRLARFDPFGPTATAVPTTSVLERPIDVPGWSGSRYAEITWARQFFGRSSLWWRYVYDATLSGAPTPVRYMFLDVVNVSDINKFSTYGIEACYRFHGYRIVGSGRVDVGAAAPAQAITWRDTGTGKMWSVVSWVSPVQSASGKRFERSTLLAALGASGDWRPQAKVATSGMVTFARSFMSRAAISATSPGVARPS